MFFVGADCPVHTGWKLCMVKTCVHTDKNPMWAINAASFGGKEGESDLVDVSSIHSLDLGSQTFFFEPILLSSIGIDKDFFPKNSKQRYPSVRNKPLKLL